MKSIAVFCGSSMGNSPEFPVVTEQLGAFMGSKGIRLVYGGAQVGLMGVVADAVLKAGGEAIGVLPGFLGSKEIAHHGLSELIMVNSMHERKQKMSELCDGVITLPGGYGTMEELFEFITWAQLGLHSKPIGLLNVAGYYDALVRLVDDMVKFELLKPINREMLLISDNPEELLQLMHDYQAPEVPKWINPETT
ncbi:MAG: TIGR00730 family Rossman fold protein [Cytophagales bacterium]|nr:TIGR00730 family Rossman fold protein [Cytophagales bacterium]